MTAAAPQPAAIRTRDLRKTYSSRGRPVEAVRGIDLDVPRGEFFGLLGPNGAGKTTTIGMLTTIIRITAGQAEVAGTDVMAHPVAVKRRIGMVSQENSLDRQLTVGENIEFRGRYFGMPARQARRRADELVDLFELGERRTTLAHRLSGGQAKRAMICRALVHRPDVLFLDEPTSGIDPQTRVNLWDALRTLHSMGQTIVLTTHYIEEAEELCERVAIVDHGRVLACDRVGALRAESGAATLLTVRYDGPAPTLDGFADRHDLVKLEHDGEEVRIVAHSTEGLLGELVSAGAAEDRSIRHVSTVEPSLESAYLNLTGRDYRE